MVRLNRPDSKLWPHEWGRRRVRQYRIVIVVMEYRGGPEIEPLLVEAATVLAQESGCERAVMGRSPDDAERWQLLTEWEGAGRLRHGLGSYAAKMALGPLQAHAIDAGGVFETLLRFEQGQRREGRSDRAGDADSAGPGSATSPPAG
ncbi:MAG: antibiotic biosynthesis monooxygenase [Actinomycetia bacterium]|nr:antibiotic biosynthesis monooxygenase [Actinomycetes bacterium]MCH9801884.1 antibiotic biosynthesis monooxygenase [Actinomycetes bacterium]